MKQQKLSLGTAQFGSHYGITNKVGQVTEEEVRRTIEVAREQSVDTVDTAVAYGSSEEILGRAGVDDFKVITKLPAIPETAVDISAWVTDQALSSIKRLRIRQLYALLLHRPNDLLGSQARELVRALERVKHEGLVRKIGISVYGPEELSNLLNELKVDVVQAPLNVVDRRMDHTGWLNRLKDLDTEIHVRSAFLQGLLLMDQGDIPASFSRWSPLWNRWHDKLNLSGISPMQACLAYPLALWQVDRVVVGVENAAQLSEVFMSSKLDCKDFDSSFMGSDDLELINPSNWSNL